MKIKNLILLALFLCMLLTGGPVGASIIGGPGPDGFGSDDGTVAFIPTAEVFNVEILDVFGGSGFPSAFGFYFVSDPSTRIAIFDFTDQGPTQAAKIDFTAGKVYDLDASVEQASFTPTTDNIGFVSYFDLSSIGGGEYFLYLDPALNSGVDAAATFPFLADPDTYLIGFEIYFPKTGQFQTVSLNIASGVKPIPEPGTIFLLGSGLVGMAAYRRKRG